MKKINEINWRMALWDRVLKHCNLFLSEAAYLKFQYRYRTGRHLDLDAPQTFTEKIQWLKLYDRHSEYTRMVDKADAKSFVADIVGEEYVVPTIGIWNSIEDIDWNIFPNQFVIKPTNDSGGIVICKDKATFDMSGAIKKLKVKSNRNFSKYTKEYPYKDVPRRIIAEMFLSDENEQLKDYKFFCFDGTAKYCQVIADRQEQETIDFYNRQWEHQPFVGLRPKVHHARTSHEKPSNYSEMLSIADAISSATGAPFIRIDLYSVRGKTYFGEITFFPMSGFGTFTPDEWNYKLGEMINIKK